MIGYPVQGFRGTPEETERQWYEQVYRGRGDSMRQLMCRAVIMGSVLGGVLSLTNLLDGAGALVPTSRAIQSLHPQLIVSRRAAATDTVNLAAVRLG